MTETNRQIVRKATLAEQGTERDDASARIVPDEFVQLIAARIRSAESYSQRVVTGGDLSGSQVEHVEFNKVLFQTVNLSKTQWHKLRLDDATLEKCELANARWTNSSMEKVATLKCGGTGLQLLDAKCLDSQFSGCKFHLAAYHGTRFRNCRWENCDLREADFEGAQLIDVVFRNCDLRAARFPNASLKNVDFRGSHLAGMSVEPGQLRGSRVDPSQLLILAGLFGLAVEPTEDG